MKTLLLCLCMVGSVSAWADDTLFLWQYDGTSSYGDGKTNGEFDMTVTTGTAKFVTYEKKTASAGMSWSSWDESISDSDLTPSGVSTKKKAMKLGNNGAHIKISPASGNFKAGDVVYICGYNPFIITVATGDKNTTALIAGSSATVIASSIATGSSNNKYEVGSFTLPESFSETSEIYISRVQSGSSVGVAAIKVVRPVATAPTITTDLPETKSYVVGDASPEAMTVAATASAGTCSYQWYSCDDTSKANEVIINTATSTSYTPSVAVAGTYYFFCRVTDNNGSTDSKVCTVTVAAASAPTISLDATSATVEVGGSITFTATVNGVPTPTLQWFSNTTASTSEGEEIDGEISESYSPSTAATGTYYYYLVATNSAGTTTSELITLTVQETCATPSYKVGPYNYEEHGYAVTISSNTNGATYEYLLADNSSSDAKTLFDAASVEDIKTYEGTFYAINTRVIIRASKDGYATGYDSKGSRYKINVAPTGTSPEIVIENTASDGNEKDSDHGNRAVNIAGGHYAGRSASNLLKMRLGPNAISSGIDGVTKFLKIDVKSGYRVTAITLNKIYSNTDNKTFDVANVYADGTAVTGFESFTVPAKNGTALTDKEISLGTGATNTVVLDFGTPDGVTQYNATMTITYEELPIEVPVTAYGWATFNSDKALDLTGTDFAYKVTGVSGSAVTIEAVNVAVEANTPLLIKGTAGSAVTRSIPIAASGSDISSTNKLVAVTANSTSVSKAATGTNYVLAVQNDKAVFAPIDGTAAILNKGQAYLALPEVTAARALFIDFDDETTGISNIDGSKLNAEGYYNLAGQRVSQPMKGLYIVNGKKVVIK